MTISKHTKAPVNRGLGASTSRNWKLPKRYSEAFYLFAVFIVVLAVFAFLTVVPLLIDPAGFSGVAIATALALIPLAFTFGFVVLIDRWEPEPWWLYVVAFVWGSGVSILGALYLNELGAVHIVPSILGDAATTFDVDRYTGSWIAPISEEFIKGLGVVMIFLVFRRYFNGPTDGIVYGALIGAGFAFTENILYFVRNIDYLDEVFQIRFLDGPLSHDIYTAFFGFFIGFAEYSKNKLAVIFWMIPAWLGAFSFHYFNNDALFWEGMTYQTYKFVSNVPLAILAIVMVWFALRYERRAVFNGLVPFVASGWVSQSEVAMLTSMRSRNAAKRWAELNTLAAGAPPATGSRAMARLQAEMIQLGHDHTRAERTGTVYDADNRAAILTQVRRVAELRKYVAPWMAR